MLSSSFGKDNTYLHIKFKAFIVGACAIGFLLQVELVYNQSCFGLFFVF